jgi:hypothetical protein
LSGLLQWRGDRGVVGGAGHECGGTPGQLFHHLPYRESQQGAQSVAQRKGGAWQEQDGEMPLNMALFALSVESS